MNNHIHQAVFSVLSKLLLQKVALMLSGVGLSLLSVLLYYEQVISKFVPTPTEVWAVRAIAVSVLSIFVAVSTFYWFRPKLKFDEQTGTNINLKTSVRYCHNCKHTIKQNVPLKSNERGWYCVGCKRSFSDPSRPYKSVSPTGNSYLL